jgi:DNA-cytosine methyltransferase
LDIRHNLQVARELDEKAAVDRAGDLFGSAPLLGALGEGRDRLNVVELFAGVGGMGLGFLLAKAEDRPRYAIGFSGELHPVYARSLQESHSYLREHNLAAENAVPSGTEALDLTAPGVPELVMERSGEVDVLIGGPPCQGMSNANRNSWSGENPHNRLIDTFIDYAGLLRPRVLLLENVQGILWTPKEGGDISVAGHVVERLGRIGYLIFPKILDAAWYGVPQHRNRFFLLGLRTDLGYQQGHFERWGPFPVPTHGPGTGRPFTTVRDAISDLPVVPNGCSEDESAYDGKSTNEFLSYVRTGAPEAVIWDHITSRHADYVIERYEEIPEGGNWEDISHMMTNYADVERTHSNIYRRLRWSEPSITIGHYRKSMIVHPSQHRGLSLREAMRLQGFPDWVRFAGSENGARGGLTHKQQQLANAVSPPVTRAIAEFLLGL